MNLNIPKAPPCNSESTGYTTSPRLRLYSKPKFEMEEDAIILDNGSGTIKIGFNDKVFPKNVFPNIHSLNPKTKEGFSGTVIGEKAKTTTGINEYTYPMRYGVLTKERNDLGTVWNYAFFNELRVYPNECPLLVTEAPLTPNRERERIVACICEGLNPPCFHVENSAVLSLYSTGRTAGCVVESGFEVTHVVQVYEGYSMNHASVSMRDIGGMSITKYLLKLLKEKDLFEMKIQKDIDVVNEIKEKLCYVSEDYNEECSNISKKHEKEYCLQDGKKIVIGSERFKAPEMMFQPFFADLKIPGLHKTVFDSITKCDKDIQNDLFNNIVLGGGGAMFKGVKKRLTNEINTLLEKNKIKSSIRIISPQNRTYSAWSGGSLLTSLSSFSSRWISKETYDDEGANCIYRQCLNN